MLSTTEMTTEIEDAMERGDDTLARELLMDCEEHLSNREKQEMWHLVRRGRK